MRCNPISGALPKSPMIRGKRAQKGVKPIRNPSYVDALGASKKLKRGLPWQLQPQSLTQMRPYMYIEHISVIHRV